MANLRSSVPSGRTVSPATDDISGDRATTCGGCSATYPDAAWASLSFIRQIEAAEIARSVLDWPAGVTIEVRRCANCGTSLARKRCTTASWFG